MRCETAAHFQPSAGTIRENIVMDRAFDDALLWKSIALASFGADLNQFPSGLETPVG